MILGWPLPKLCLVIPTFDQDGHEPSNDYFIKIVFLLSKWFQKRRFLWEFPLGSYAKSSPAVVAILPLGQLQPNFVE
jgi:hypothetical protein